MAYFDHVSPLDQQHARVCYYVCTMGAGASTSASRPADTVDPIQERSSHTDDTWCPPFDESSRHAYALEVVLSGRRMATMLK